MDAEIPDGQFPCKMAVAKSLQKPSGMALPNVCKKSVRKKSPKIQKLSVLPGKFHMLATSFDFLQTFCGPSPDFLQTFCRLFAEFLQPWSSSGNIGVRSWGEFTITHGKPEGLAVRGGKRHIVKSRHPDAITPNLNFSIILDNLPAG